MAGHRCAWLGFYLVHGAVREVVMGITIETLSLK